MSVPGRQQPRDPMREGCSCVPTPGGSKQPKVGCTLGPNVGTVFRTWSPRLP